MQSSHITAYINVDCKQADKEIKFGLEYDNLKRCGRISWVYLRNIRRNNNEYKHIT